MQLPQFCYATSPITGATVMVYRGETALYGLSTRTSAAQLNARMGVSAQAAAAMLGGAMHGWDSPAADPQNYTPRGMYFGPEIKKED